MVLPSTFTLKFIQTLAWYPCFARFVNKIQNTYAKQLFDNQYGTYKKKRNITDPSNSVKWAISYIIENVVETFFNPTSARPAASLFIPSPPNHPHPTLPIIPVHPFNIIPQTIYPLRLRLEPRILTLIRLTASQPPITVPHKPTPLFHLPYRTLELRTVKATFYIIVEKNQNKSYNLWESTNAKSTY